MKIQLLRLPLEDSTSTTRLPSCVDRVLLMGDIMLTDNRQAATTQICDGVHPIAHPQRLKDAGHMLFDRAFRQAEHQRDAFVGQAAQHQCKHITLARRQA